MQSRKLRLPGMISFAMTFQKCTPRLTVHSIEGGGSIDNELLTYPNNADAF